MATRVARSVIVEPARGSIRELTQRFHRSWRIKTIARNERLILRIHIQIVYHIRISSRICSEYIRGCTKIICSYLLLFYLILANSSFCVYFSTFSSNMYLVYSFVCWLVASVIVACSLFYIIYTSYFVIFIYVIFMSVCLVLLIYFLLLYNCNHVYSPQIKL